MIPYLLRSTFGRQRWKSVQFRAAGHDQHVLTQDIEEAQVERFNQMWSVARQRVPFYRSWARENGLPDVIQRPVDLLQFPRLTKATIVERQEEIFADSLGKVIPEAYSTGGTTGTPTRYPRGPGEGNVRYANAYLGRSWWGLRPFDSYVHIWGHAHLFGGTPLARMKRQVQDRLVNATRLNAYDMSPQAIAGHVQTILKRDPSYIVGYASAIFRIARYVDSSSIDISRLGNLRAVIVTAETVTESDVALIKRAFRVPVIIEYGAAETGVLAYSRGDSWPLQVLWQSFIINVDDHSEVSVTTLDDRVFPLINYYIGDTATVRSQAPTSAISLDAVTGRAQDTVTVSMTNGELLELSPILPVHILKSLPSVTAVQYQQASPGRLRIFIVAEHSLSLDDVADRFTVAMKGDHPNFDRESVSFVQVAEPVLTKSGKQALFV